MTKGIALVSLIAIIVVSGAVVFLQNNESPLEQHVSAPVSSPKSASKAYIDPNTGGLTSTPPVSVEQTITTGSSKFVVPSNNKRKSVEMIYHDNGMVQVKLNGNAHSNTRVTVDCNSPEVAEYLKESSLDITDCEAAK